MTDTPTPRDVERRLVQLGRELDAAFARAEAAEHAHVDAKHTYDVESAKRRVQLRDHAAVLGEKITVQEVEDRTMVDMAGPYLAFLVADAEVRLARHGLANIRTQIDTIRSIGASVRSAMELI